ncbi:MAG: hypothetical protein J6T92_03165, partial [Ottowia sp.]|nr:hypothetical protein [Ottowia sp.]
SGEGFPQDEQEFAAWRRAGVIIRLGQAGQFYESADYGDAIGWSFNHAGTQAVNTCWKWGDDGLKRGQTWALTFSIGALQNDGMAAAKTEADLGDAVTGVFRNIVLQYIAMVEAASAQAVQAGDALQKAALYAFRRAPAADILARAIQPDVKAKEELDYWGNYTAQPIAAAWVHADMMGEGILYSHLKPKAQPQIKFPDVAMGGCISFDFSKDEDAPAPKKDPKCDTIMHAYFVGDDLKVVKYCRDEREKPPGVQRDWNEGEERAVGSWTEIITYTPETLMGNFYTSDFDERVLAAARQKVTKTVGRDLGYGYPPAFSYVAFYDMRGTMWRYRFAQHDTTAVESKNYRMDTAILVPYFAPHAALHAWRETDSDLTKTVSRSVPAFLDPNSYAYWTYDSVFAWRGGIWPDAEFTITYRGDFVPSPLEKRKGVPVWVMGYSYDPWGSSFADNGDWLGALPQDITHIVHPDANAWVHDHPGGSPTVKSFSRTEYPDDINNGKLDISLAPQPQNVHTEMPHRWYFEISPDEWGNVFYRDAVRCEAGNVDYCNCSELKPDGFRYSWGRNEVADSRAAHHFIGVLAQ